MYEIKAVRVLQAAKVIGVMYFAVAACVAFVVGVVMLLRGHPGRALLVIFMIPILYGAASFLITAIVCSVYNQVAAKLGGVELELSGPAAKQA